MIPIQDKGEALRLLSDEELTARVDAYMKGKYLHESLMKLGFKKWAPHLQKELCDKTGLVKIEGYAEPIQSSLNEETWEYKANFLWGFPDDSIESIGYEFANGKTENYQKECWNDLMEKIKSSLTPKSISDSELAELRQQIENGTERNSDLIEENISLKKEVGELEERIMTYELEKSASLKPNKLSDEEIEKMAEEWCESYHDAVKKYARKSFIAGCKAILER